MKFIKSFLFFLLLITTITSTALNLGEPSTLSFSLYEPTYVLPFYYSTSPYYAIYEGNTPDDQTIQKEDFAYQLSFKIPLWQNILGCSNVLYAAYTQDSFWQVYNESPFFRETNYEPALFLANTFNKNLGNGWYFNELDLGAFHQSNGRGGTLERSWNRVYATAILTHNHFMLSVQPWYPIFSPQSMDLHNPDIMHYMGYGQILGAYTIGKNTFSLTVRNEVESGFSHGAEWFTWSHPIVNKNINLYLFVFSGYGQSLIEYDHYTNGAGIGIALNDWSWQPPG